MATSSRHLSPCSHSALFSNAASTSSSPPLFLCHPPPLSPSSPSSPCPLPFPPLYPLPLPRLANPIPFQPTRTACSPLHSTRTLCGPSQPMPSICRHTPDKTSPMNFFTDTDISTLHSMYDHQKEISAWLKPRGCISCCMAQTQWAHQLLHGSNPD